MAAPKAKAKTAGKTSGKAPKKIKAKSPNQVETNLIRRLTVKPRRSNIPEFSSGDTLNVYVKVKEGDKERVQLFKGTVIKIQGHGAARSFTVRKMSAGVGVERTFPFSTPGIDRVELVATGKVRRSKLYYLRDLDGRAAKIESELYVAAKEDKVAAPVAETPKA